MGMKAFEAFKFGSDVHVAAALGVAARFWLPIPRCYRPRPDVVPAQPVSFQPRSIDLQRVPSSAVTRASRLPA